MEDPHLSVPDAASFERLLTKLIRLAHENGIDIEGGWDVDGDDGHPDWDVVVTVVDRAADD
ncbi:hypothetical protein SAMN05216388_1003275 [Halorientalis persicus]|jgi:hypothetical protein|uniref:Uncharacterized protein n=1 Tax=Halorientalis persicus TaxID=1367881 RepID=A0A1H8H2C0_9EURY|nr:hypothetical protein [Halorientalis persicus]SEN50492.1 hypothetical protein SAMN05216388_1003275 [Halorientalis persicus]